MLAALQLVSSPLLQISTADLYMKLRYTVMAYSFAYLAIDGRCWRSGVLAPYTELSTVDCLEADRLHRMKLCKQAISLVVRAVALNNIDTPS